MKIGILGSGVVGQTIGSKLVSSGYEVRLGSRTARNEKGGLVGQAGRTARGTEAVLALWVRLWGVMKTGDFNIKVVR